MENTTIVESRFESDGKSYLIKFGLIERSAGDGQPEELLFSVDGMRLFILNDGGQWEPCMLNGLLPIESNETFRA